MAILQVTTEFRQDQGKGASRRLRRAGKVPAVLYGGGREPLNLQFDQLYLQRLTANEAFYTSIMELAVEDKVQKAILRDMQRHPFKPIIMHLDLQRVSDTELLRINVPLHFLNEELSPAGKSSTVMVLHELNQVEVSCLPKDLPAFIEVDLGKLQLGDVIHLSEIKLPPGVEVPALAFGKEHDIAVVIAKPSGGADAADEEAAEQE